MSTAGKVLSVCSVLLLAVWIVLMAGVAQLNMNYGEKVVAKLKELDELKENAAKTRDEAIALKNKVFDERRQHDEDNRVLDSRIVGAERNLSAVREALSRVTIQVTDYQNAVKEAQQTLAFRTEEQDNTSKKLADTRAAVEQAKATNAELKQTLEGLQSQFVSQRVSNVEKVQDLLQPSARPASFRN